MPLICHFFRCHPGNYGQLPAHAFDVAVADVFPQNAPALVSLAAAIFAMEYAAVSGGLRSGPGIAIHSLFLNINLYFLLTRCRLFIVMFVLFAWPRAPLDSDVLEIGLLLLSCLGPLEILREREDIMVLRGVSCYDPSILEKVK